MSDDSSKPEAVRAASLPGWLTAVLSLLTATVVYFVIPIVAATVLFIALYVGGQSIDGIKDILTSSVVAQFFYILLAEVFTVLVIYGILKLFRWNWKTIGLSKPRWFHPLLGIAALIPYFLIYIVVAQVVSKLVAGFDINQVQEIGFENVHGGLGLTLTFISLVILPPLAEEITMRGFLYTGLRKWLPRIAAALAVSVLFGAAHLAEGGAAGPLWIGALDTAILSMVLIGLREWTGNLWAGITLHASKNLVAFIALFVLNVH